MDGQLLFFSSSLICSISVVWSQYVRNEKEKLKSRTKDWLCRGFIKLPNNLSFQEKHETWFTRLLPQLIRHWETIIPGFDIQNISTWPHPDNGRAYHTTLQKADYTGMRPLFSSNYEIQSLIYYTIDPSFRLLTFREQTHWKICLLYSSADCFLTLLNKFIHTLTNSYDICGHENCKWNMAGSDRAWYLPNWPSEKAEKVGCAWVRNTHIDSGYENMYSEGVPTSITTHAQLQEYIQKDLQLNNEKMMIELSTFLMLMKMIGIIFQFDTPSLQPIESKHGTTGLFPYSPIILLTALQRFLEQAEENSVEVPVLSFSKFNEIVKSYGEEYATKIHDSNELKLIQPSVQFDEVMVAFGPLIHTSMWAVEPIACPVSAAQSPHEHQIVYLPRILENAKIHFHENLLLHSNITEIVRIYQALPPMSPLKLIIQDPLLYLISDELDNHQLRSDLEKRISFLTTSMSSTN